jgi:putative transposase
MGNFVVAMLDRVWLADITQLLTKEDVLYVGLVMDLCSRMIVGWATRVQRDRWLTMAAVEMAIGWRRPPPALIHHTDQGGQYACPDYVAVLVWHGILPSMSPPGSPIDNAPMEILSRHSRSSTYTRVTLRPERRQKQALPSTSSRSTIVGEDTQLWAI